jgi:DNA polymerase (family 10)
MSKNMTNQEIAHLLRQVAAAFEVEDDNFFRVRAYQNAASSIEESAVPLKNLWEKGKLDDIPGIGPNIAQHLDELFKTGKVKHFMQETRNLPQGMFALLSIPNIGPKTAYKLAKEFKLESEETAIQNLFEHAKKGDIRDLPDFGEKSEQVILESLKAFTRIENRMLLIEGETIAETVIEYLRKSPDVVEVEALGSLRRRAPTVGDVDIAVSTTKPDEVISYLLSFPQLKKVLATGENVTRFMHSLGRQVDVKVQSPKEWGSTLQHYTGSKLHNIHLRTLAQRKDWSLSEYGIKKNSKLEQFRSEKEFYRALGLELIPPELREDAGEIEAAANGKLPNLIDLNDIKGDLHIHTNIDISTSHDIGQNTVTEILEKASELGYKYIGLSDHNPKLSDLTPEKRQALVRYRNEFIDNAVESFNSKRDRPVYVFKGLEIDIRPDGSLALENDSLELLDYAIASVHAQFQQDRKTATKRVLQALSHPKVKIFGHPTGRMLLKREGLDYDWEKIFSFCQENNKVLEINSSPYRLDLPEVLIRQAISHNVDLIINSDSHNSENMPLIKYGVWNARRGWAEAKNILNTKPLNQVGKVILGK